MPHTIKYLLALLISVTIFTSTVLANVAEDTEEDGENAAPFTTKPLAHHQNMFTACILPKHPRNSVMRAGEIVDVLIGVSNTEAEDSEHWYRAEYAVAYLFNMDPAFHVQNFTGVAYNRTVLPGETATLNYRIRPDPRVEPKEYHLVVQLFYMNERNETFLVTPFNNTIQMAEMELSLWDLSTLWSYGLIIAVFVGLAVYPCMKLMSWLRRKGIISTSSKSKKSTASAASPVPAPRRAGGEVLVHENTDLDWSYVPQDHRQLVLKPAQAKNKVKSQSPTPAQKKQH